jgi:SNF2 family DNA or RNA helicase
MDNEISRIFVGKKKKPSSMRIPNYIPPIDDEQEAAAFRMYEDGYKLLFSDPGAGKTLTALVALEYVTQYKLSLGEKPPRVVVMCPTIAVRNWATWTVAVADEQIEGRKRHSPVTVQIIRSSTDKIREDANVLIVTYGLISRKGSPLPGMLRIYKPHVLICDESDNLNGDSNRTDVILDPLKGLATTTEWTWFLTGTPIPRYQDGLWPVLRCCFPDRLAKFSVPTRDRFVEMFCYKRLVKYGGMRFPKEVVSGNRNTEVMHKLLYSDPPIAIRNKLKLRDEPVLREVTLDVDFSKEFLELERRMKEASLEVDDYGIPTGETMPELAKALRMLGEESATEVAAYAAEYKAAKLAQNSGVLILFWHRAVGDKLVSELRELGYNADMIRGDTPQNKRDNLVDLFNEGRLPFLVGQIAAMGVALNLQKSCHTVIFAEETFSDAANRQAFQRVWRRGQDKVVDVIFCRTLSDLADLRPRVAARKAKGAASALDGTTVTEV